MTSSSFFGDEDVTTLPPFVFNLANVPGGRSKNFWVVVVVGGTCFDVDGVGLSEMTDEKDGNGDNSFGNEFVVTVTEFWFKLLVLSLISFSRHELSDLGFFGFEFADESGLSFGGSLSPDPQAAATVLDSVGGFRTESTCIGSEVVVFGTSTDGLLAGGGAMAVLSSITLIL